MARSTRFSNSRTLPGHEYCSRRSSASLLKLFSGILQLFRLGLEEVVDEGDDILAALAQWRQMDRDDVETVVQVRAEGAVAHPLMQVAVGGGDDPYVDADGLLAADTVELALFEGAQDFRLRARRHLGNLVEEERPLVGELELPELLGVGIGEGPAFVAEQLAFEQVSRGWRRS